MQVTGGPSAVDSKGVAGADTGKEGYLNESATHSPEGCSVANSEGKLRGKLSTQRLIRLFRHQATAYIAYIESVYGSSGQG